MTNSTAHEMNLTDAGADEVDEDPYQLFPSDLDQAIAAVNLQQPLDVSACDRQLPDTETGRRSWEEVIPGIDPETKRMYEQWDEITDGSKDVPISSVFDPPIRLPPADRLTDQEVSERLNGLLAAMALHGVALDICEHFAPRDSYRLLVEQILPEAQIHPKLSGSGYIQHYSTWEHCAECNAEFDADYEARKKADPDGPPAGAG